MSAVDNKNLLEIIAVNLQSGVGKKSLAPYALYKAQCILKSADGTMRIGELMLPKTLIDTVPGKYLAEFELDVSMDLRVVPRVTALHPYGAKGAAPAPVVPAAKTV